MSETIKLGQKLCNIQSYLDAPKNQRNNFGGYNYRSCEDILEALKPLLAAEGCFIEISDSIELIGDRYYVKATASIWDCECNSSISATAYAREEATKKGMDASQITGATSSYARKYALCGLFAIDDNKDADATNEHGKGGAHSAGNNSAENKQPKYKPVQADSEVDNTVCACANCGKNIEDHTTKENVFFSKNTIIHSSITKHGVPLCFECAVKMKEDAKAKKKGADK